MSIVELRAAIDSGRLRRDVEHIASTMPYRLAGTPAADAMARYSAARLCEAGAIGRVETIAGYVSVPEPAVLVPLAPESTPIPAQTCGHSPSTTEAGLVGDLFDVGGGAIEDYARIDVAGRIVLADLALAPARPEKLRLAEAAGALGLITINWGHADGAELPFGSVKPAWGNPTPASLRDEMVAIPCIGIARAAGLELKARLRTEPLRVRLHARSDNGWRPVSYTLGEIPGATPDFVIAGGHQDSWIGPAATDNATGSACLLELARLFSARRSQLRRGIMFAFWAGHETGTMLSSADYVDRNWDRLREHAVAYLQIDQPGCAGATRWSSHSNNELKRFQERIDSAVLGDRARRWRRSTKIGDSSFFGLGVPMLASIAGFTDAELEASGNAAFGWWHHTTENTLDKVDFDDLAVHVRVYAAYLWELCTAPILPFDFATVAGALLKRLAELVDARDELGLGAVLERAQALHAGALRLDDVAQACNRDDAVHGAVDEERATVLNSTQKRLSRILLNIEATTAGIYGHDPYALTAQSTVIPALYDLSAWAALPEGERRKVLETKLRRERNRVSDALADACALIDTTLERIDVSAMERSDRVQLSN
jgi:hypothetical protein